MWDSYYGVGPSEKAKSGDQSACKGKDDDFNDEFNGDLKDDFNDDFN